MSLNVKMVKLSGATMRSKWDSRIDPHGIDDISKLFIPSDPAKQAFDGLRAHIEAVKKELLERKEKSEGYYKQNPVYQ